MPETQAVRSWCPPVGTLGDLVAAAGKRASALDRERIEWRARAGGAPAVPSLRRALLRDSVAVIAEVKRSSPSKGRINPGLDAATQARSYARGGAAAISVLTEPERFGGSTDDLSAVAAAVPLPVVKKDFHVMPVQLYQARALGASAALLIVRALEPGLLREMVALGHDIGLELIVEVRDKLELGLALDAGARIVGVNNRNLETLVIDPSTAQRVVPMVPRELVAVAESGMASRADVERAGSIGADAVLVGSAVSAAADPCAAVSQLVGAAVQRDARAG